MNDLTVKKIINLKAEILDVWEALTSPELTKKYFFNCEVITDWKAGSNIIFMETRDGKKIMQIKGRIDCIQPGLFVNYSAWSPGSGLADIPENYTMISYRLSIEEGHTELIVTQENFRGDEKRYNDSARGWDVVLGGLKNLLENNKKESIKDEDDLIELEQDID